MSPNGACNTAVKLLIKPNRILRRLYSSFSSALKPLKSSSPPELNSLSKPLSHTFAVSRPCSFTRILTVDTAGPSALCVLTESSQTASTSGRLLRSPPEAFVVFFAPSQFFMPPPPTFHHDSLALSLRAAAVFPFWTTTSCRFHHTHYFMCFSTFSKL